MRARLIVVFLVPLMGILLLWGSAYATSTARAIQQEFEAEQLGDLSFFVTSARYALSTGESSAIDEEVARYREVYGSTVLVYDRWGALWSEGTDEDVLDDATMLQVRGALSGRRGERTSLALPWTRDDAVFVEPVFDDRDVVGAVVLSASTENARREIAWQWALVAALSVLVVVVLILGVRGVANWVIQPVRRVDQALAAIERGEMAARIADDTGPRELRGTIRAFNTMADEVERMMARQQEFALNASHELRNPLGALLMRVEHLSTGLGPQWQTDIEETREEGRRMTRILDTLLNLARGDATATPAVVDLAEIAAARVEAWQENAVRQGIVFARGGDAPVPCVTDRTAVESALDAVIDNAVKFSPEAGTIEVTVWRTADGGEIVVADEGPGLTEEELERVTHRFWRSARDQNVRGSGLGLAIATDLLSSLGGRLRVEAPESGGLRVSLWFPAGGSV